MIKVQTKQIISVQDWDSLVEKTYGRTYNFQQQNDCQDRGHFGITIPDVADDFENDTVIEKINGRDMGVSFAAWLARDPNEWNGEPGDKPYMNLFWGRNFYPDIQTVANDLHAKGLIPAGDYLINIDW
jgi:hypothetical protein